MSAEDGSAVRQLEDPSLQLISVHIVAFFNHLLLVVLTFIGVQSLAALAALLSAR